MSKVYLFTGIETQSWQLADFQKVCDFCKAHNVDGMIVKTYEITQGEWYPGIGGPQAVANLIASNNLDFLFYGFYYGVSSQELTSVVKYLANFGRYCLNLEGAWDNNPSFAQTLFNALQGVPGEVWVSTWANPVDHGWLQNISILDSKVSVWMPEEYGDANIERRLAQFPNVKGKIYPTYSIADASNISLMARTDNPSLWEWQDAQANPTKVDAMVAQLKGILPMTSSIVLNSKGMIADVPKTNQLFETSTESDTGDLCGPWSVAAMKYSGFPGVGLTGGSPEEVDAFTDVMLKTLGYDPKTFQGSSIQDMENFLHYAGLHYWEIPSDVATIAKAVQAGYPVLFTANEQNIISAKTKQRAYPWSLNVNHILPVAGLNPFGDFICPDQLNNSFQGEWPCVYLKDKLQPSYAVVVRLPFLQPIPSGNPNDAVWVGFNAQIIPTVPPIPVPVPPPPPTVTVTVARSDIEALIATLQKMLGA